MKDLEASTNGVGSLGEELRADPLRLGDALDFDGNCIDRLLELTPWLR